MRPIKFLYLIIINFLISCTQTTDNKPNVIATSSNTPSPDKNKYVSQQAFSDNLKNQLKMTPQTMSQLREAGVTADKELKLEYFFYTNSDSKATQLADELKKLNYSVSHRLAADSKTEYIITGWTTKMKMADEVVSKWTKDMCELGFKFDCDFDGWGTQPE